MERNLDQSQNGGGHSNRGQHRQRQSPLGTEETALQITQGLPDRQQKDRFVSHSVPQGDGGFLRGFLNFSAIITTAVNRVGEVFDNQRSINLRPGLPGFVGRLIVFVLRDRQRLNTQPTAHRGLDVVFQFAFDFRCQFCGVLRVPESLPCLQNAGR